MKKIFLYIVGILLIILLLWKGDFQAVFLSLTKISFVSLCYLCLLQIITIIVLNIQWILIAKPIIPTISFKTMFSIQMVGTFFESITPAAKTGGEAVKTILLKRNGNTSLGNAMAVITVQKFFSMLAFIPLASFSAVYFVIGVEQIPIIMIVASFLFLLLMVLGLVGLMFYPNQFLKWLKPIATKQKWAEKVLEQLDTFTTASKLLLKNKRNWFVQIFLAFFIWSFFPYKAYIISNSLQIDVSFLVIMAITFIAYLVALLPLTPGGLGTFEGSAVFLLGSIGIGITQAIALAIVLRFITYWFVFFISAIYSGILYLNEDYRTKYLTFLPSKKTVESA